MPENVKQINEYLQKNLQALGIESSEATKEAELIIEHLTGWDMAHQIIKSDCVLSDATINEAQRIINQRQKRMPLQYCLGQAPFMGFMLKIAPGVLIPRTDTETLVVAVLNKLGRTKRALVADIGVGSGAIAIALAKSCPDIQIVGLDISAKAVAIAQTNINEHSVADRVTVIHKNWQEALPYDLDVIVSNPPYISATEFANLVPEIRNWEPQEALLGDDPDGLGFYRELSAKAARHLKMAGFLAVEIPDKSENAIKTIFGQSGWRKLEVVLDVNGLPRVLIAMPPETGFSKS